MAQYIAQRLLQLFIVLVGVSMVVFVAMHLLPGDVAQLLLGDHATAQGLARLRAQLGLDQPVWVQYLRFLADALRGNFGVSLQTNHAALDDVLVAFPVTLQLTLASLVIASLVGVPLGVLTAVWHGTRFDTVMMTLTLFGVSMPIFWFGLMLLILFAAVLGWVPTGGLMPIGMEPPRVTGMSVVDSILAGDPGNDLGSHPLPAAARFHPGHRATGADHPHHARRGDGRCPVRSCAYRTRQGADRPPRHPAPCPAQRGDSDRHGDRACSLACCCPARC